MSWEYHMCCGCGYAEGRRRNYEWNDWRRRRVKYGSAFPLYHLSICPSIFYPNTRWINLLLAFLFLKLNSIFKLEQISWVITLVFMLNTLEDLPGRWLRWVVTTDTSWLPTPANEGQILQLVSSGTANYRVSNHKETCGQLQSSDSSSLWSEDWLDVGLHCLMAIPQDHKEKTTSGL